MSCAYDVELMVKHANVLGRLYRGTTGAIKSVPKGMLIGGALGAMAAPIAGVGLGGALGVGGAGAFAGSMIGGGLRGTIGGIRGLLSNPGSRKAVQMASMPVNQRAALKAGATLPILAAGGGLGYMLSGEDNKMLGTGLGVASGLLARPALLRAIAKRAQG